MELVPHEDVHSRQASVLTFKCSLSKDGQWMRSLSDCDPQNHAPRRVYLLNSTWITELNMRELKLSRDGAWTFIHGCMLLICFVICNIIRLLSVFVLDHCVDSYHFLGVYTELAALTFAPKSVAGARPHFSPLLMTSMITWTNDCDLPAPTPTTYTKHTPRAVA